MVGLSDRVLVERRTSVVETRAVLRIDLESLVGVEVDFHTADNTPQDAGVGSDFIDQCAGFQVDDADVVGGQLRFLDGEQRQCVDRGLVAREDEFGTRHRGR